MFISSLLRVWGLWLVTDASGQTSAMAIIEQGLLPGGGPEIDSGKAQVYCSDKPLEDITYKAGVRANAPFEVIVDANAKIAMFLGCLFFRTTSDGILTEQKVHHRAVLGVRDTVKDETVWSADPVELMTKTW